MNPDDPKIQTDTKSFDDPIIAFEDPLVALTKETSDITRITEKTTIAPKTPAPLPTKTINK